MGRGAGQTTILAGSGARFAGLVARPANTALVGEASRGAPAHTGTVVGKEEKSLINGG